MKKFKKIQRQYNDLKMVLIDYKMQIKMLKNYKKN